MLASYHAGFKQGIPHTIGATKPAGTDGIMPAVWPAGATVVLLDGAPEQLPLLPAQRRVARHYRIGPASLPVNDPTYVESVQAFDGNGLRPYRPAHLRATAQGGDIALSWVRRTRIDGDSWESVEVPLGEEREQYLLRIMDGTARVREVLLDAPQYLYSAAQQAADGFAPGWRVEVAQVAQGYGAGPFAGWTAP
jgi:hypothetical protein